MAFCDACILAAFYRILLDILCELLDRFTLAAPTAGHGGLRAVQCSTAQCNNKFEKAVLKVDSQ